MSLKGKTTVITGGAQGIGKAIGMRLARDGANIGILDLKKEIADKTAKEITALGVRAVAIQCDATDYAQVKGGVAKIKQECWDRCVTVFCRHRSVIVGQDHQRQL